MMKTLRDLYREHEGKVSDKWDIYLEEYDRIFHAYRNNPVKLLEIGVQNGGSLEVWQKYFPNAVSLIGCDINEKCGNLEFDSDRISVVVGDANSSGAEAEIKEISDEFDIIIDDGSHTSGDIIKSFAKYFPYLKEGGVFVAEDLHCSYWQEFNGGLYDLLSSISFFKQLSDITNYEHWGAGFPRQEVINVFREAYSIDLSEEDLASIHSVEFVNSMCVIRKLPACQNELGPRNVAGSNEQVVPGHKELEGEKHKALCQRSNPESALHPYEQILNLRTESDRLRKQLDEKEDEISRMLLSRSWRITAPLRKAVSFAYTARRYARYPFVAVNLAGGPALALRKALNLYRAEGVGGLRRGYRFVAARSRQGVYQPGHDYAEWIRRYDTMTQSERERIRAEVDRFEKSPTISIVMPVYNPDITWLEEAINSLKSQLYPSWELCIADDSSSNPEVRTFLRAQEASDSRIKVEYRQINGHISAASNSAMALASGDWVALMDQDDLIPEHALYWVVKAINDRPDAGLIYSDEDKIDERGKRHNPYFKCDWNRALFYSQNMICHLGVYKRDLLVKVGGFIEGLEGAQDHDLALRIIELLDDDQIVHIPRVLYHWRVHSQSTAGGADAKPYAIIAGEKAISAHMERMGVDSEVTSSQYGYRVQYRLPKSPPKVSLVIPTRNGFDLVKTCIESIVKKTDYPNYEIILIDNGSDDPECLQYFSSLEKKFSNIRVKRDDRPFNYSALNNDAVRSVDGEIVGLLNNDIEVVSPEWLSEMVAQVIQPGVGAVGAKLLYPNGLVQHAGVAVGLGGVAGHVFHNFHPEDPGYFSRLNVVNEYSAVTAACLLVKKSDYEKVDGLNEHDLKIAFNDVDFCLKLKERGLRNVFTPYAVLFHHESATRGYENNPEKVARFNSEVRYMESKWKKYIANDPCYNPNLSLDRSDFSLAWPSRVKE